MGRTGRQLSSIPFENRRLLTPCPLLGERPENFYARILSPATSEKTAETPTQQDPAITPTATRRSRLRFHIEHNTASAGEVAGATGLVEVEVAA